VPETRKHPRPTGSIEMTIKTGLGAWGKGRVCTRRKTRKHPRGNETKENGIFVGFPDKKKRSAGPHWRDRENSGKGGGGINKKKRQIKREEKDGQNGVSQYFQGEGLPRHSEVKNDGEQKRGNLRNTVNRKKKGDRKRGKFNR